MSRNCRQDPTHKIQDDADVSKIYCSTRCRVAAHRARTAARLALLDRMTAALASGADELTLSALRREADRLKHP